MATRRMQIEVERRLAKQVAPAPARRWRCLVGARVRAGGRRGGGRALAARRQPARAARRLRGVRIGVRGTVTLGDLTVGRRGARARRCADRGGGGCRRRARARQRRDAARGRAGAPVARRQRARRRDSPHGRQAARRRWTHRRPDETFAVITKDMRVEVRGTKFSVLARAAGSRVEVTEGQVAVVASRTDAPRWSRRAAAPFERRGGRAPEPPPAAVRRSCRSAAGRACADSRVPAGRRRAPSGPACAAATSERALRHDRGRTPRELRRRRRLRRQRARLRRRAPLPERRGAEPGGPARRRRGRVSRARSAGRALRDAAERAVRGGAD